MPDYIDVPITTDPDVLAEDAFAYLQGRWPDWVPNAGNLETWLLEANARIAAEVRDLASRVPTSIFRYFGPLVGVLPIDASRASANTTWTLRDTAGHTIPAGTHVGIRTADGELIGFEVAAAVVVAPGASATPPGGVTIIALDPGEAGSGLGGAGGPVELVDPLDFVTSIVLTGVTTGGVDAEPDIDYLNRLRAELQLLTPRPILPRDFEVLARETAGVHRALALDGYNPDANERQTITVTAATGGTFTLTFAGQTTAPIAYNATAAAVQAALEALSNLAPGDVVVTGGPLMTAVVQVEFAGAYAGTNVAQMTADGAALTGAGAAVAIATTRQGSPTWNNERYVTVAVVDEAGQPVSNAVKSAVDANLQSQREVNFVVRVIDPTYTTINVNTQVTILAGYTGADVAARIESALASYLSPATWGRHVTREQHAWVDQPVVRYLEVAQVINNVDGVDYITSLQMARSGQPLAAVDVNLTGPAALPQPGVLDATVV